MYKWLISRNDGVVTAVGASRGAVAYFVREKGRRGGFQPVTRLISRAGRSWSGIDCPSGGSEWRVGIYVIARARPRNVPTLVFARVAQLLYSCRRETVRHFPARLFGSHAVSIRQYTNELGHVTFLVF